jgi:oligosaccharyltransferase complex subunit alpha (ribophorin I)
MLQHWRTLSILALAFVVPALSLAGEGPSFENTAIVRTVELSGSLVHVTTTYAAKALEAGSKVYTIALGPKERERISWLQAKIKGQQQPLHVMDHGFHDYSGTHLLSVELPKALGINASVNLVLETVETHATRPWPQTASQKDSQSLKYDTSLFVLSPYHTVIQRTKIKSPNPLIHSFTTLENLGEFTLENPVTKSGATVTYGPYNNIPSSSNTEFIAQYQKVVTVHFKYDQPVLEVTKLKRAAEISHWGANLNIQDEIHLHNAGPLLKGHFSRLEHQTQGFFKRDAPHALRTLTLHLPAGIHNTYFYDLIGNVSTSHLRTVPSVPKESNLKQFSVFELKPRFPLMGGWNYSFTLGWDSPLADSAAWDKKTGRYLVQIPVMTLIPGAVVNQAEVSVILPEGATDVQFVPPFPAVSNWISTTTTYLDTTGRPTLTFEYSQLTDRHTGSIYVSYKVPFSAHLKKPLAVATAFFSLFVLALGIRRIDLRIHKKKLN